LKDTVPVQNTTKVGKNRNGNMYLSFTSFIDPGISPSHFFKQQNALALLKAYSFVTEQADDQTVSLHRLVHVAIRNWLRSKGILEKCTVNTAKRLGDIFPSDAHENRILWRQYLPHALFILQSKEFQNDGHDRKNLGSEGGTMPCL
jgi:hypothetical protein